MRAWVYKSSHTRRIHGKRVRVKAHRQRYPMRTTKISEAPFVYAYHGTNADIANKIMNEGLQSSNKTGVKSCGLSCPSQVYMTTDKSLASNFSDTPSSILKIRLKQDEFKKGAEMAHKRWLRDNSLYMPGEVILQHSIPNSQIMGRLDNPEKTVAKALGAQIKYSEEHFGTPEERRKGMNEDIRQGFKWISRKQVRGYK